MSAKSSEDVVNSAATRTVEPVSVVKASDSDKPLLEVQGLRKVFKRSGPWFQSDDFVAVENVSFQLMRGQTVGLVGESGSGKTTVGLCLLRLHEASAGKVLYEGKNLLEMSNSEFATYKRRLQIVFQNPYASLNPRFTVGEILSEPMQLHGIGQNSADWEKKSLSLLDKVGMPASALKRYPFEFSGGQRQRISSWIVFALPVPDETEELSLGWGAEVGWFHPERFCNSRHCENANELRCTVRRTAS
jgi:peptide/nickel transport system ATP-binding protein